MEISDESRMGVGMDLMRRPGRARFIISPEDDLLEKKVTFSKG